MRRRGRAADRDEQELEWDENEVTRLAAPSVVGRKRAERGGGVQHGEGHAEYDQLEALDPVHHLRPRAPASVVPSGNAEGATVVNGQRLSHLLLRGVLGPPRPRAQQREAQRGAVEQHSPREAQFRAVPKPPPPHLHGHGDVAEDGGDRQHHERRGRDRSLRRAARLRVARRERGGERGGEWRTDLWAARASVRRRDAYARKGGGWKEGEQGWWMCGTAAECVLQCAVGT
jgi:hypothetical protein